MKRDKKQKKAIKLGKHIKSLRSKEILASHEPLVFRNPCKRCLVEDCPQVGINNHLCLNYNTK